jgi:hypothetical protein
MRQVHAGLRGALLPAKILLYPLHRLSPFNTSPCGAWRFSRFSAT